MNAQLHRFRDQVAIHLGDGQTQYLTVKQARAIARQLNKCSKDIDNNSFQQSTFKTFTILD